MLSGGGKRHVENNRLGPQRALGAAALPSTPQRVVTARRALDCALPACRDLGNCFIEELEGVIETHVPAYSRSARQHMPTDWLATLTQVRAPELCARCVLFGAGPGPRRWHIALGSPLTRPAPPCKGGGSTLAAPEGGGSRCARCEKPRPAG